MKKSLFFILFLVITIFTAIGTGPPTDNTTFACLKNNIEDISSSGGGQALQAIAVSTIPASRGFGHNKLFESDSAYATPKATRIAANSQQKEILKRPKNIMARNHSLTLALSVTIMPPAIPATKFFLF